jgi:hypothetical protein
MTSEHCIDKEENEWGFMIYTFMLLQNAHFADFRVHHNCKFVTAYFLNFWICLWCSSQVNCAPVMPK